MSPLPIPSLADLQEEERQIEQEQVASMFASAEEELQEIDERQDALLDRLRELEDESRSQR